jgi:MFS family permease
LRLVATCAVGFGVLFNLIAIFTYVTFHLAAPPYNFSPSLLGVLYFTYLIGTILTPLTGRSVLWFGRRSFMIAVIAIWTAGLALLLASPVMLILLGLSLCAGCGMLCQAITIGYMAVIVHEGRSSAIGLYESSIYIGGSVGGFVAGVLWSEAGWPAVVTLSVIILSMMGFIVTFVWVPAESTLR